MIVNDGTILNRALLDYLRLTSYESILDRIGAPDPDQKRITKRMQYKGRMYDGVFIGAGLQAKRTHFMLEASGSKSEQIWRKLPYDLHATRIDLQVTLPVKWSSIEQIGLQLRDASWGGPRRQVRMITNDDRQDTCYIGSRRSAVYIRIYAKGMPDEQAVRFEVEFKREYADGVWTSLHEGVLAAEMLAQEIWRLPMVPALRPFQGWSSEWERSESAPVKVIKSKRGWIESTCIPALWKMATSHEGNAWLLSELTRLVQYMNNPSTTED